MKNDLSSLKKTSPSGSCNIFNIPRNSYPKWVIANDGVANVTTSSQWWRKCVIFHITRLRFKKIQRCRKCVITFYRMPRTMYKYYNFEKRQNDEKKVGSLGRLRSWTFLFWKYAFACLCICTHLFIIRTLLCMYACICTGKKFSFKYVSFESFINGFWMSNWLRN